MAEQVLLAISTFPDAETANRIAHALIAEKFTACANIIPAVHSIYRWKDKIETAGEVMVFSRQRPIGKQLSRRNCDHFIRTRCLK